MTDPEPIILQFPRLDIEPLDLPPFLRRFEKVVPPRQPLRANQDRKVIPILTILLAVLFAGGSAESTFGKEDSLSGKVGCDVQISAGVASVPMGKAVTIEAIAKRQDQPASGLELWAYLNGRQWGAQGITDASGRASFILPLPYAGNARIQVAHAPEGFKWATGSNYFGQTSDFTVGTPLPKRSACSNAVKIVVTPRKFSPVVDPSHLIGSPWSPWFTRYNAHIDGGHTQAEAVPLLGSYASTNADVIRQQMLWMDEIGVNFIQVDWSNNLTNAMHWKDHVPGVEELIGSTRALMDTLAVMRSEGLPAPRVVILFGMAPPFSMGALNEELRFAHDTLIANPKYAGFFMMYQGKPLANVLSVLDAAQLRKQGAVDTSDFTIRWVWDNVADRPGWWSWTDDYLPPTTTRCERAAESMSVTCALAVGTGWKDPRSLGKRGGTTWVRGFQEALRVRPGFLFLHQFNDWAEEYDTELSDDIEPASLASLGTGARGNMEGRGRDGDFTI